MAVIASSVANVPHIAIFDAMVEDRCANFPVEVVITFLMQILPATALGTMATDLGVNGIGGFAQAQSEQERRDILSNAIRTRTRAGTPWALKRAIETLGYSTPIILEGVGNSPVVYDGTYQYNGNIDYQGGNNGWAQFMVVLPESELVSLSQAQVDQLVQYINFYKNERSELVGLGFFSTLPANYDGLFQHNGQVQYDQVPAETLIFVYP